MRVVSLDTHFQLINYLMFFSQRTATLISCFDELFNAEIQNSKCSQCMCLVTKLNLRFHPLIVSEPLNFPSHLWHNSSSGTQREIMHPLQEVHVIRVGSKEHRGDGIGRRCSCFGNISHPVAYCVHVHVRSLCRVHIGKCTVRICTIEDDQIVFTVQQLLSFRIRKQRLAGLQRLEKDELY